MAEELRLPPHIELRQGLYFNKLSGRWVGAYKIKEVCDLYWLTVGKKGKIKTGNGTVAYKKDQEKYSDKEDSESKPKYVNNKGSYDILYDLFISDTDNKSKSKSNSKVPVRVNRGEKIMKNGAAVMDALIKKELYNNNPYLISKETETEILDKPTDNLQSQGIAEIIKKDGATLKMAINKINLQSKVQILLFDGKRIFRFKFLHIKKVNIAFNTAKLGIGTQGYFGALKPSEKCFIKIYLK